MLLSLTWSSLPPDVSVTVLSAVLSGSDDLRHSFRLMTVSKGWMADMFKVGDREREAGAWQWE